MASAFAGRVVGDGRPATAHELDEAEAARAVGLLTADWPGPVGLRGICRGAVWGQWVGDPAGLVARARDCCRNGYTPYFVLNPFRPGHAGPLKDEHVGRRRWLLIDVDPAKPAEHKDDPATDVEKNAAAHLAFDVLEWLADRGWPPPLQVDSGNGGYLLYRIDLPADDDARALVAAVLHAVKARFLADPRGKIDTTVSNAARLAKLPGGLAIKGTAGEDRPYRRCRLLHAPDELRPVPEALLRALAGCRPEATPTPEQVRRLERAEAAFRGRVATGGDAERRAAAYLAKVPGAVSGQRGHAVTLWAARVLVRGFLLSQGQALRLLAAEYNPRCDPPWSDRELEHKVAEAADKPFGKPDGWMLDAPAAPQPAGAATPASGVETWSIRQDDEEIAAGAPESILPDVSGVLAAERGAHARTIQLYSIGAILRTQYPEPNWVVPGIMSEGLNLLAGAPKQGKSVLALNLALTVAGGGVALGSVRVQPADVLYLSLEDKFRRVKHRACKMLREVQPDLADGVGRRLVVATEWPRQHEHGLAAVAHWIKRAERPQLVIIDVWYRFAPPHQDRGNSYAQDAEHMGQLKRLADSHGVSFLVVHHTRKANPLKESDDYLQEVSGTMGITGAADGILVLVRQRNDARAVLNITGRDVGEQKFVLEFDKETLTWRSLGTEDEHIGGRVKQAVIRMLRGRGGEGAFLDEIVAATEEKKDSVSVALSRMYKDGVLARRGHRWVYPGPAEVEVI